MATLPSATTRLVDTATAIAQGAGLVCVVSPCPTSDDAQPRLFGSAKAIYDQHGYCPGVEYAAIHASLTGLPILFVGIPIASPGAVGREDSSGNGGTSDVSVAVGSDGALVEHSGRVRVKTGGTVGTDQIVLELSLDDGKSWKPVRLGTATSYVVPYVGVTITLTVGSLVAGETVLTWHATGPRGDASGWDSAFTGLAAQQQQFRTGLLCGDVQDSTEAGAFQSDVEAYETSDDRFVTFRMSVPDRLPLPKLSDAAGSIEFADADDTITRANGSWVVDGFKAGDSITVAGTSSNDGTFVVTDVTTLVLTVESDDLSDETVASGTTASVTETKAAWAARTDAEFGSIDDAPRVNLSWGRASYPSPFSQWNFRVPAAWLASAREYQHDVHIASWRKSDGPIGGASLQDAAGALVEWDDRVDGGAASAARFTAFRTWGNGPQGVFVARDLTRATDASVLLNHNGMNVANLAQQVCQAATENAIGRSLVLNDDGTATRSALAQIAGEVNTALENALLANVAGEGQRASKAVYTPSTDDVLNTPDATLTGVLTLNLLGTIVSITTNVRVLSGGQQ